MTGSSRHENLAFGTCLAEDCGRGHYARGYCVKHYQRVRRYGSPAGRPASPLAVSPDLLCADGRPAASLVPRDGYERLAARLLARSEPGPEGCWLWQGALDEAGYGRHKPRSADPHVSTLVHRAMWSALVADPAADLHLDHLCRRRSCCNPDHLDHVTPRVNLTRGLGRIAARARQRRCVNGHEFTTENTLINKNGTRACRLCNAARQRATRQRGLASLAAAREADGAG
jgi:hypothetical protein